MVPFISCAAVADVWTVGGSVALHELYFNQQRCGVFKLASFLWFYFKKKKKKAVASRETDVFNLSDSLFRSYVEIWNVKITKKINQLYLSFFLHFALATWPFSDIIEYKGL